MQWSSMNIWFWAGDSIIRTRHCLFSEVVLVVFRKQPVVGSVINCSVRFQPPPPPLPPICVNVQSHVPAKVTSMWPVKTFSWLSQSLYKTGWEHLEEPRLLSLGVAYESYFRSRHTTSIWTKTVFLRFVVNSADWDSSCTRGGLWRRGHGYTFLAPAFWVRLHCWNFPHNLRHNNWKFLPA